MNSREKYIVEIFLFFILQCILFTRVENHFQIQLSRNIMGKPCISYADFYQAVHKSFLWMYGILYFYMTYYYFKNMYHGKYEEGSDFMGIVYISSTIILIFVV